MDVSKLSIITGECRERYHSERRFRIVILVWGTGRTCLPALSVRYGDGSLENYWRTHSDPNIDTAQHDPRCIHQLLGCLYQARTIGDLL